VSAVIVEERGGNCEFGGCGAGRRAYGGEFCCAVEDAMENFGCHQCAIEKRGSVAHLAVGLAD